jgi:putative nucleotidyltransferase with HDIG domain
MKVINQIIETQEFATLPPVAAKVLSLLNDENVSIRDLAAVIEADASLTLKLLRVANSPLYGHRSEITSINQAIVIMGLNRLTNVVLGVSIFSKFLLSSQRDTAKLMEKFWWHSSCTGMVAKALSKRINNQYNDLEFIGGLLHDVGKLAMIQYDVQSYNRVIELINIEKYSDIDAEKEIFGVDHTKVGAEIAKLWKLPVELISIIANHSNPVLPSKTNNLISIVRVADLLCETWDADFYEGPAEENVFESEAWRSLVVKNPNLNDIDTEMFSNDLREEFKKSADFLNILIS